jgi:hypothetical protein
MSVGNICGNKREIVLKENQRITGVISGSKAGYPGYHRDLQFMICD